MKNNFSRWLDSYLTMQEWSTNELSLAIEHVSGEIPSQITQQQIEAITSGTEATNEQQDMILLGLRELRRPSLERLTQRPLLSSAARTSQVTENPLAKEELEHKTVEAFTELRTQPHYYATVGADALRQLQGTVAGNQMIRALVDIKRLTNYSTYSGISQMQTAARPVTVFSCCSSVLSHGSMKIRPSLADGLESYFRRTQSNAEEDVALLKQAIDNYNEAYAARDIARGIEVNRERGLARG